MKIQKQIVPIAAVVAISAICVLMVVAAWWYESAKQEQTQNQNTYINANRETSVNTNIINTNANTNLFFLSSIKGCAETNKGMTNSTKGVGNEIEKLPTINVNGQTVTYSRAINHQCCRKVEITKEINNLTINIYEKWSGSGCKCMCFSEIEGTLNNVPADTFNVNVYETGTKPNSNEPMEQTLIISKEIVVKPVELF